jgi:hypothetical protein
LAESNAENISSAIKVLNLPQASLKSLELVLPSLYGGVISPDNPIKAKLCPNRNYLRNFWIRDGNFPLPVFAYTASAFDVNRTGYNIQALRHIGFRAGITRDGESYMVVHATPMTITVVLAFIANNYNDVIKFSTNWIHQQRSLSFELSIDETGHIVPIQVVTSEQLTVPDLPSESDGGEVFFYETTLTMHTYSGTIQKIPSIVDIKGRQVVLNTTDDVNTFIKDTALINDSQSLAFEVRSRIRNLEL